MKTYDEVFQNVMEATNLHQKKVKKIQQVISGTAVCTACALGLSVYLKLETPETRPAVNTETTTATIATIIEETMDSANTGMSDYDPVEMTTTEKHKIQTSKPSLPEETEAIPVISSETILNSEVSQTEIQTASETKNTLVSIVDTDAISPTEAESDSETDAPAPVSESVTNPPPVVTTTVHTELTVPRTTIMTTITQPKTTIITETEQNSPSPVIVPTDPTEPEESAVLDPTIPESAIVTEEATDGNSPLEEPSAESQETTTTTETTAIDYIEISATDNILPPDSQHPHTILSIAETETSVTSFTETIISSETSES